MTLSTTVLIASLGMLSVPALAAYGTAFENDGFVADDWQLVCDNTLTCRAAGYSAESERSASILMTLKAGATTATTQVLLNDEAAENTITPSKGVKHYAELWLNDKFYGKAERAIDESGISTLSASQTMQLIQHARKNTKIEFRMGSDKWQVSDTGMTAVLLKLDEVQGRVGSPLALVSQNHLNRHSLKQRQKKPIIHKAFAYSEADNKQLDAKGQAYFEAHINSWVDIDAEQFIGSSDSMGECELINPNSETSIIYSKYASDDLHWTFTPIDSRHTLASHPCWTGAYNMGSGYWVIDNNRPNKPKLITTSGSGYSAGEIFVAHKSRGLGDCWWGQEWVWDGKTFAKAGERSTGMCRGFAGGAWDLPTYVSEVIDIKTQ